MTNESGKQHKEYMIDKAKRSFLRMVSPGEFGSSAVRDTGSVSFMNLPPELARRDAAYLRAAELLKTAFAVKDEGERRTVYMLAETFLEFAVSRTESIFFSGTFSKKPLEEPNILRYLKLIRQMVGTLGDMTEYQQFVRGEDQEVRSILGLLEMTGNDVSSFSGSEAAICHFLRDLLEKAEKPFVTNRTKIRAQLSKSGMERYDRAFEMAKEFCSSIKPSDPDAFEKF